MLIRDKHGEMQCMNLTLNALPCNIGVNKELNQIPCNGLDLNNLVKEIPQECSIMKFLNLCGGDTVVI